MLMHPIVSACGTTTYNTAKFITKILQNYCGKTSSFLKDSTDFIKKIKHLSINPMGETLVSFDVSALFTSIPVPVALQVINSKISTGTNFTNVCKTPIVEFNKLLELTLTNWIFCFNIKFYKQLQSAAMGSPVSPVITNIYMEYFESIAIPSSPALIKWWFRYVDDVHSVTRKHQANKLQKHLNSIDPHIKFTIKLPETDGLPFLDTMTKLTPNSIESTVYRKPSHTDRYLGYNSNFTPFQQNYLLSTLSSTELNKYVLHLNSLQRKWITFTKSYKTTTTQHCFFFQQGNPQQKGNKRPNPSTVKFIEGARVALPYIKGLSEQYRHTLAKYRVRVFFKGTSTIKSLLMHPKDPTPDAQKTDIIYHWKCPVNNCTAECIGETNRSLKERVSDHRNQTTSAIRNHHISTKYPKAELKDFTIIDRESNNLHHQAKKALHIYIKDINRSIGKVRIPSVFNKLLKPPRQLELPHRSIPYPRGAPSLLGLSTQKTINHSYLHDLHLQ